MRTKRVLLVASAGGHWVQLGRLSQAFDGHEVQYVTTMAGARAPSGDRAVIVVPDASRDEPARLVLLCGRLLGVLLTFRPDLVVTTGAAPGLIALRLGKLLGARTVWIDSIANSEEVSLSGRLAGRFADLWLTQWEHLAASKPGLRYLGGVL